MMTEHSKPEGAGDETPANEELQEPSTEKAPDAEPKAPAKDEAEPSHEAVGIGVIGDPDALETD